MSRQSLTAVRSQAGFTLVELAVVMIIIGLLIGGVLKGQELVKNAQITATISQLKGVDAATSTFRDMYNGVPGDLRNAGNRIPGCGDSAICSTPGAAADSGNSQLNSAPGAAPAAEAQAFFIQLALADLLTGIDTSATACTAWGLCFPEAKAGSGAGLQVGYYGGAATLGAAAAGVPPRGHYVTIQTDPGLAVNETASQAALTPNQAARIDSKVDDGNPTTGSVVSGSLAGCRGTNAAGASVPSYNEASSAADCNLYVRIQG